MMIFEKIQKEFPSKKHKDIWRCGINILPEELVLSNKVKTLMDDDLFESCRQLYQFLLHSLSEMYENAESYDFNPNQYIFMWLWLGNTPIIGRKNFASGRIEDKKLCNLISMEDYCGNIFAKTGVELKYINDSPENKTAEIISTQYPNMFRALNKMFMIVRTKRQRTTFNSFYECDFRLLCSGYKYGKGMDSKSDRRTGMSANYNFKEKAAILLDEEYLNYFLDFIDFIKNNELEITKSGSWRAVQYKNKRICSFSFGDNSWSMNFFNMHQRDKWFEKFDKYLTVELKEFILNHINTTGNCCVYGKCNSTANLIILGKLFTDRVCKCGPIVLCNPDGKTLEYVKELLLMGKMIIADEISKSSIQ